MSVAMLPLIGSILTNLFGLLFGPSMARATAQKERQQVFSELPKMLGAMQSLNPAAKLTRPYLTDIPGDPNQQMKWAPPTGPGPLASLRGPHYQENKWKKALSAPQFRYGKPEGGFF